MRVHSRGEMACALLCACLAAAVLAGCGGGTEVGRQPVAEGVPDGPPAAGEPAGGGPPAGEPASEPLPATAAPVQAWRAQVWRVWPGPARLEREAVGCFLGGFVVQSQDGPAFLLISPVALGSDAPAANVVSLAASGELRELARLEDIHDYHWAPGGGLLVGIEGTVFFSLAPDGSKVKLHEGEGLCGADLLRDGCGMVLLERDPGGGTVSLVVASGGDKRVVAERVADLPPEPELGGWALAPCRVSADGARAAVAGTRGGKPGVIVVELATGAVTVIPVDRPWGVAWAPDGNHLAVPGCGVFSVPSGARVVSLGSGEASLAWSGDGRHLLTAEAVVAVPEGARFPLAELGLVAPPGAQVRPLGWVAATAAGKPPVSGEPAVVYGPVAVEGPAAFVVVSWREGG